MKGNIISLMTDNQKHEIEFFVSMPKTCWEVLHNHSLTIRTSLKDHIRDAMNQLKHSRKLKLHYYDLLHYTAVQLHH